MGRGLRFVPSVTGTDHLVPPSAITANSTAGCLLSVGITSPWAKERMLEGGWRGKPMFVISRQRNACQSVGVSWKWGLQQLLVTGQLVGYKWPVHHTVCHPQGSLPHSRSIREQKQLPVPNIYVTIEQIYGNAKIAHADAIPGSRPGEQSSSHPLRPTVCYKADLVR